MGEVLFDISLLGVRDDDPEGRNCALQDKKQGRNSKHVQRQE